MKKAILYGKRIISEFNIDFKYFSFNLACVRAIEKVIYKLPLKKSTKLKITKKKNTIITIYLATNYKAIFDKYKFLNENKEQEISNMIWVFWWQGSECMPVLIKKCIKSIYQYNNDRDIKLITKDNYSEFVNIPEYMLEKMENGAMGLAHFSDYIRSSLIANYGGLWLDATLYCVAKVPNEVFENAIYSGKSKPIHSKYISGYKWTTFMLAGNKNNVLFEYLCDFFLAYWQKESVAIDYLFFDHLINLAYENFPIVKKQIDEIPFNTVTRDYLAKAFYQKYSPELFNEIYDSETWFYKVSWREPFPLLTKNNEITNFNFFINS